MAYPNFKNDTPEFGPGNENLRAAYTANEWRIKPLRGDWGWDPKDRDTLLVSDGGLVLEEVFTQPLAGAIAMTHNKMLYDALALIAEKNDGNE